MPRKIKEEAFYEYFRNYYDITINELQSAKKGDLTYFTIGHLLVDNAIEPNELTEILLEIAHSYNKKNKHPSLAKR